MGNTPQQKPKQVLHYHRLDENKLWIFYPDSELYSCFAVHTNAGPFFFGDMETIGVPSLNTIFVIGGSGLRNVPQFVWTENPFNARMGSDGDDDHKEPNQAVPALPVLDEHGNMVTPHDGSSQPNAPMYARAQKIAEGLVPVSTVGYITIDSKQDKLMFTTDGCEQLLKPRTAHSLIFCDPYIYMIGGVEDRQPVHSCRRFHVKDKVWSEIASLKTQDALNSPGIIALPDSIFVFDTYSETQTVFKYSLEYDSWEPIPFKTIHPASYENYYLCPFRSTDFVIPKSLHSAVFRFDENTLMLMNGITENKELSVYYYMYDMEKNLFIQERSDRKLIHPFRDRQGNRDYKSGDKIFCQLSEGKVKCFSKKSYYWDNLTVYLLKVRDEKDKKSKNKSGGVKDTFGCFGDKKSEK